MPLALPRAARGAMFAMLVGTAATLLLAAWPGARVAYRGAELHVALETAGALVALVAGFLLVGRFSRRRRLDDLLLAVALVLFGIADLGFLAAPSIFGGAGSRFSVWTALVGRTIGAVCFAVGAVGLARRVRRRQAAALAVLAAVGVVAAAAIVVAVVASDLPRPVHELARERSGRARLIAHPAVLAVQLVAMVLFAVAAGGLVRRAVREHDRFLSWLAAGSVLAAFARLHYFLYPSLYTEWVYSGDVLRLLFHVTVLAAAALEVRGYWRTLAEAAVLDERRRIARDLHDGLAQELAYISRNLRWLDAADETVTRIRAAADRALIESRRAVAALTEPVDRPLPDVLAEAIQDVAAREQVRAVLDLDPRAEATAEEREALVRIACEAVTNAARHGRSRWVRVELRGGNLLRLRVSDAGTGFDPDVAPSPGRFGLTSMRERTRTLGGRFRVLSAPGRGTEVEVEL